MSKIAVLEDYIDPPLFIHTPLDRCGDSIRLVKILPKTRKDGIVECSMHHAKLSPGAADGVTDIVGTLQPQSHHLRGEFIPYICLSYTWGSPQDENVILVNGKLLIVRKNLASFLRIAEKHLAYGFFWIDALCIDQSNAAERDHQVQRMGNIFAKAKLLITWLGCKPELYGLMVTVGTEEGQTQWDMCKGFYEREHGNRSVKKYVSLTSDIDTALDPANQLQHGEVITSYTALTTHGYWRRAWVTQEIMLAKAIYIVVGKTIVDYPSLVRATRPCAHISPESHFEQFARLMLVQRDYFSKKQLITGRILISDSWLNNWGLVNLIHHFGDKCCAVRRDMVYSVLSLSREAEMIKVNYQSPTIEVVRQILEVCKDSVCLCAVAVLVRTLRPEIVAGVEPRLSAPFVYLPIFGVQCTYLQHFTRCPACRERLQFPGRSRSGQIFCLLSACKDSEGHIVTELAPDGRDLLKLESISGGTETLGEIGEDVSITQESNSDNFLLTLSFLSLLRLVNGTQWGRTLRRRSCGNFWPDEDKPSKERLTLSA